MSSPSTQLQRVHPPDGRPAAPVVSAETLTPEGITGQVALIQQVMRDVMRDNEHYGVIPGTQKPTLLKPGAEKLSLTFRLAPDYDVEQVDLDGGHREYRVHCRLTHIPTGQFVGAGVGLCTTMESRYRYRKAGRRCPECGEETIVKGKAEYGGGWLCFKKKGGCGAKFRDGDRAIETQAEGRVENEDLADAYNTVLKMAKKRALVDAILTATAASDIFAQDIEDLPQYASPEPVEEPGAGPSPTVRRIEAARRGEARLGYPGEELHAGPPPKPPAEEAEPVAEADYATLLGALREWAEAPRPQRLIDAMHDRISDWPDPWGIRANEVLLSVVVDASTVEA